MRRTLKKFLAFFTNFFSLSNMEGPQTITKTKTRTKAIIGWTLIGGAIVAAAAVGTVSRQKVKKAVSDAGGTGGVSTIANQKSDLKIQLVSLLAEPPYNVGDPMVFRARVVNIGTSNAAATTTSFSLDIGNNGTWEYTSASGVNPSKNGSTVALAPNEYAWAKLSWTGASTIPPGSFHYKIRACADGGSNITELDESNNCREYVFWPQAGATEIDADGFPVPTPPALPDPDLIIDSVSFQSQLSATNSTDTTATPFVGNQITFFSTSENDFISAGLNSNVISMVEANTPASQRKFRLDIGNDNTWDIDTLITGSDYGWTAVAGTHKFEFCADGGNTVTEFREDNNCMSSLLIVAAQPPAQFAPDLVVTSLGFDADNPNLTVGGTSSFAAVVSNQGTVGTGTTFTTRLRLDLNNDGSWDVAPPTKTTNILNGAGTSGYVTTEVWQNFWTSTAGTHKAEACADVDSTVAEGVIAEGNESNNCAEFIFTINSAPAPDLVVDSITVSPTAPTAGIQTTVSTVIRNQGTVNSTFSSMRGTIDVGSDNVSGNDPPLANMQVIALTPNATATKTWTWTTVEGTHNVTVCADPNNQVANESDENNNCKTVSLVVGPTATADLIIESATISPIEPLTGSTATVSVVVRNQGIANATGSYLGYKLDIGNDGLVGAGEFSTYSTRPTLAIPSNTATTVSWSLGSKATGKAGTNRLDLCTDQNNTITESNENNNCTSFTYTVTPALPDLTVSIIDILGSPTQAGNTKVTGSVITILGTVLKNVPSSTVTTAHAMRLRLDIDNNGTWDITRQTDITGPFETSVSTYGLFKNMWTATAGTHLVEICADVNNIVSEVNEDNNCNTKTFTINAGQPDLVVEGLLVDPLNITAGATIGLYGTVKHSLGGPAGAFQNRLRIDIDNNGTWDITPDLVNTSSLSFGQTTTLSWSNAWTATAGLHKFEICVDINNAIVEYSESNCKTMKFAVGNSGSQSVPNLIIQNLQIYPTNPTVGQAIRVTATIKNTGAGNAGSFANRFNFDEGSNGTWDFIYPPPFPAVSFLGSTESVYAIWDGSSDLAWNWRAVSGTHRLRSCVDENNTVSETDEADNCFDLYFTVP